MNRREFVILGAASTLMAGAKAFAGGGKEADNVKRAAPPRNRRPYAGLDWNSVKAVRTTTHGHCISQKMLDGYLARGFEFLTVSNYYPSAPWFPLRAMTESYFRLHHDHPVMVKGRRTNGPFDWNGILDAWKDELEGQYKKQLPFKEGGRVFKGMPSGLLEAPNAEHHGFNKTGALHMCAPGSNFKSGTFDARDRFHTMAHGYHFGSGEPWQTAVGRMLDGLVDPDGGGVTINHPSWSKLDKKLFLDILDYDPRVLGCEVFNQSCKPQDDCPWSTQNTEDYWDYALSTGRQCFGFFVPDWGITEGENVLLVPAKTVHECLKAYRQGNWYGAIKGKGLLRFTCIAYENGGLHVETDKPSRIQVISKMGVVCEKTGRRIDFRAKESQNGEHVYLRTRAYATDGSGEAIFSQPFMLF